MNVYKQMRDTGVSEAVCRQKAAAEGIEPAQIDSLLRGGSPTKTTDSRPLALDIAAADASPYTVPVTSPTLTMKKYKALLLSGVSKASVRQRMATDGCSVDAINEFFASVTQ